MHRHSNANDHLLQATSPHDEGRRGLSPAAPSSTLSASDPDQRPRLMIASWISTYVVAFSRSWLNGTFTVSE